MMRQCLPVVEAQKVMAAVVAMMVSAATVEVGAVVHIRVAVVVTAVVKSTTLTNFNVGYLFISRFFCTFAKKDIMDIQKHEDCPFCGDIDKERIIFENNNWVAFLDAYPVSKGHTLLVPKIHRSSVFELPLAMKNSIPYYLGYIKDILADRFKPDGFNVGVNDGEAAGQTIPHCHIHIIPRYIGDVEDPKGGVRGVIPSKQKYG